jgi:2',3'-cyclic-nucleotide 2'-phosphodiesterase (5'-nucleotidase family)
MSPRLLHYSDVENAYDDPERIGRLAGQIGALDGDDAVVVGSGDNTAPGVLSLVTEGRHSLPFFDAIDADFDTFGNHDFDYGPTATEALVADAPQTWLTANVEQPAGVRFASEHTEPLALREVADATNGEVGDETKPDDESATIGFFGVTTPATNSINPNATDVTFTDPIAAGERAAAACREAGADYVVAISHLGTDDEELAVAADVDVVLGGHVHSEVQERVNGAIILRPGVNGSVVYEIELPAGSELGDKAPPGDVRVARHDTASAPVHEGVASAMRDELAAADLDEVVAVVDDPIERTQSAAFRGESRIGNFVADAYRWATGADVGLQNAGGVREGDALAGEVTIADVMSVVPFQEPVSVCELTGAELRATIRQASGANLAFGEPDWWHAHLSGASVRWDRESREIVDLRVDGDPVDDAATYRLATTDYLFHTDHEFPALTRDHRVERGDVQYEVLAAYAREQGLDPELDGRIRWAD